jgi:ABC-type phosphate/phosphonate transport system substrate-binding protein
VQVVYFSGPIIPFENVAFASTLTQAQQDRLTNVWLAIAETTLGRRALKDVFNIDGLERGDDSLYDSFRSYLEASGATLETVIE